MKGRPRRARTGPNGFTLTIAERKIMECIALGWGYKRIARVLEKKRGTVEAQVYAIARKLPKFEDLTGYAKVLNWIRLHWNQEDKAA